MKRSLETILILASLCYASRADAVVISIDTNGWAPLGNFFVAGPSGYNSGYQGTTAGVYALPDITVDGNYNIDFTHNPAVDSPDFRFVVSGGVISSVTTSASGTGPHTMVTGFTPGDTSLILNTHSITYNANNGQTGKYFIKGLIPSQSANLLGPAVAVTAIPGGYNVDNTYNTGSGTEDFAFIVNDDGSVSASPGTSGASAIPHSEYATFSGSSVNVNNEVVHFVATSSDLPFNLNQFQPVFNSTLTGPVREFDIKMTIGNGGAFFSSFGNHDVTAGNAVRPDGTPWVGYSSTNDYRFVPQLRYDGVSNANGFYWQGAGPGYNTDATGTAVGFYDDDVTPLTISVVASLPAGTPPVPEPSTFLLLGLGMLGLVRANTRKWMRRPSA